MLMSIIMDLFIGMKWPLVCNFILRIYNDKSDRSFLTFSFAGGILRGSRRDRLLSKFVENECEKIDRLMELYMRYLWSVF